MTNGKRISKKTIRRRIISFAIFIALGILAIYVLLNLIHIGLLRVEYAEALYQSDTTWANIVFKQRQAIGTGSGILKILYNLPFMLKIISLILSLSVLGTVSHIFYDIYKMSQKRKRRLKRIARTAHKIAYKKAQYPKRSW